MNKIVYFDGRLADHVGVQGMNEIGQRIATMAGETIDIMTHGDSLYHQHRRLTYLPLKKEEASTKT